MEREQKSSLPLDGHTRKGVREGQRIFREGRAYKTRMKKMEYSLPEGATTARENKSGVHCRAPKQVVKGRF